MGHPLKVIGSFKVTDQEKGEEKEGETRHNSLRRKKKYQNLLVQGLWKVWPSLVCVAVCQNWNVKTGGRVGPKADGVTHGEIFHDIE